MYGFITAGFNPEDSSANCGWSKVRHNIGIIVKKIKLKLKIKRDIFVELFNDWLSQVKNQNKTKNRYLETDDATATILFMIKSILISKLRKLDSAINSVVVYSFKKVQEQKWKRFWFLLWNQTIMIDFNLDGTKRNYLPGYPRK